MRTERKDLKSLTKYLVNLIRISVSLILDCFILQCNFYQNKFEFPANFAAKASPKRAGPARTGSVPVLSQGQPLGFCFDFAFTENFSELESQKL